MSLGVSVPALPKYLGSSKESSPNYASNIKLVPDVFCIYFTKRKHYKKYEKCLLFHRKSLLCSRDIEISSIDKVS